jgi:hypothetical protein
MSLEADGATRLPPAGEFDDIVAPDAPGPDELEQEGPDQQFTRDAPRFPRNGDGPPNSGRHTLTLRCAPETYSSSPSTGTDFSLFR